MNMNPAPVPRLDLSPRLERRLSLWNPLDYLRLLLWAFYFPQALRWYVETFVAPEYRQARGRDLLPALQNDPALRSLVLQALLVTILIPLALAGGLSALGVPIVWGGVAVGVAVGVALGVAVGVAVGVAGGLAYGVAFGVAGGVAGGVAVSVAVGVAVGVAGGVAGGVAFGVAFGVAGGVAFGVAFGVAGGVAFGVAFGLAYGVAVGVAFGVAYGVAGGVAGGVAVIVGVLRPEAWLLGQFSPSLARVTPLPLPGLRRRLRAWLEADWEGGLRSADQFLRYSLQFIPVVGAVNDALALTPFQDLLPAVSLLADSPYDWDLLRYASAPLANGFKKRGWWMKNK
jgi:hypothetical protein